MGIDRFIALIVCSIVTLAPMVRNEYVTQSAPHAADECSRSLSSSKVDIFFIVDSSSSIHEGNFTKMMEFVASIIEKMTVSNNDTRIGLMQYNSQEWLEFSLNTYQSKQDVLHHVRNIRYLTGVTYTGKAIKKVLNTELVPEKGYRSDVPNIVVVLTDGLAQDDVLSPSNQARDRGIVMFAIGITYEVGQRQLLEITGYRRDRLFLLNDFESFNDILSSLEHELAMSVAEECRRGHGFGNGGQGYGGESLTGRHPYQIAETTSTSMSTTTSTTTTTATTTTASRGYPGANNQESGSTFQSAGVTASGYAVVPWGANNNSSQGPAPSAPSGSNQGYVAGSTAANSPVPTPEPTPGKPKNCCNGNYTDRGGAANLGQGYKVQGQNGTNGTGFSEGSTAAMETTTVRANTSQYNGYGNSEITVITLPSTSTRSTSTTTTTIPTTSTSTSSSTSSTTTSTSTTSTASSAATTRGYAGANNTPGSGNSYQTAGLPATGYGVIPWGANSSITGQGAVNNVPSPTIAQPGYGVEAVSYRTYDPYVEGGGLEGPGGNGANGGYGAGGSYGGRTTAINGGYGAGGSVTTAANSGYGVEAIPYRTYNPYVEGGGLDISVTSGPGGSYGTGGNGGNSGYGTGGGRTAPAGNGGYGGRAGAPSAAPLPTNGYGSGQTSGSSSQQPQPTTPNYGGVATNAPRNPSYGGSRPTAGYGGTTTASGNVEIRCDDGRIQLALNSAVGQPFGGVAFVKGHFNEPDCRFDFRNKTEQRVSMLLKYDRCGLSRQRSSNPPGISFSTVVIFMHHPQFITDGDKAYRLSCFYMESEKVVTQSLDISMLTTQTVEANAEMPACQYTLREGRLQGPPVKTAIVGMKVVHRWDCEAGMNAADVYGMRVHTCFVRNNQGKKVLMLDEAGCAVDKYVLDNLKYTDDLMTAYVDSYVFKFADSEHVFFDCQISLCLKVGGGCQGVSPPNCTTPNRGKRSPDQKYQEDADSPSYSFDLVGETVFVIDSLPDGSGPIVDSGTIGQIGITLRPRSDELPSSSNSLESMLPAALRGDIFTSKSVCLKRFSFLFGAISLVSATSLACLVCVFMMCLQCSRMRRKH